ncbi:MAG TPA: hypothetical protein VIY48_18535 [Candidatus Paceibacterota bacterium]
MGFSDMAPYLEGAFLSSMMQDWQQTNKFIRDPHYRETNPILGQHPSSEKLAGLGLAAAGAQYGVYRAVPDQWKTLVALAPLMLSLDAVNSNRKLGFPIDNKALGLGALVTALEVYRHNNAKDQNSNMDLNLTYDKGPGFMFNYRW